MFQSENSGITSVASSSYSGMSANFSVSSRLLSTASKTPANTFPDPHSAFVFLDHVSLLPVVTTFAWGSIRSSHFSLITFRRNSFPSTKLHRRSSSIEWQQVGLKAVHAIPCVTVERQKRLLVRPRCRGHSSSLR